MKRITLLAVVTLGALIAFTSIVSAQDAGAKKGGKRNGQTVERQLERMTKALDLTDAQKPKVKAALEETSKKRQALMDDTSLAPRDRRPKMTALMEEQNKQLKAILTPEQFTKLEKQREEDRAKAKNKAPGTEKQGKKRQAA